ncbi:tetratricopeptide repeat-containing sensor histidine kinase [candidate division WOR-3 bacterium]|nr:tetratricopeptide repeat-containing sensor histidine kinase [candidate division WOR-3 bacterium]
MADKTNIVFSEADVLSTDREKATYLLEKAKEFFEASETVPSFNCALTALEICEKNSIEDLKNRAFLRLGFLCFHMSDFDKAIEYFQKVASSETDPDRLTSSYEGMGVVFAKMNLTEKALFYMKKSLEIREKEGLQKFIQQSCNNIANVYRRLGDFAKSLEYLERAKKAAESAGNKRPLSFILNNIGEVYRETGALEEALSYYEKAIALKREIGDRNGEAPPLFNFGLIMKEKGDTEKSLEYVREAFEIYFSTDNNLGQMNAAKTLSELYEEKEEYQKALYFSRIYAEKMDVIFNEEKTSRIAEMDARFEVKLRERETEIYRMKNEELAGANMMIEKQNAELAEKNEELTELNKSKDAIMRVVSHDLKGTIGSIIPLSQMLAHLQNLNAEAEETLEVIKHYVQRALVLVEDILEINKIESEDFRLELAEMNIADLISEFAGDFRRLSGKKGVNFELSNEGGNCICMVDFNRFWQIMQNLFSNALKFTPRGGRISITHKRELSGDILYAVVSVEDSGIGIPEEMKPKIFDKFTEAKREGTEGEQTTGLGLSIVKRLIELHGGEIGVFSKTNEGSVFTFRIPACP